MLIHKPEKLIPVVEMDVTGKRTQVIEEGAPGPQFFSHLPVDPTGEIEGGMKEKRQ